MNAFIDSQQASFPPSQTSGGMFNSDDESNPIEEISHVPNTIQTSSTIPLSQKHIPIPPRWEDKSQPNIDYNTAKQRIRLEIRLEILKCGHDSEPTTVFTQQTLSELNPFLSKHSDSINHTLFVILDNLLEYLQQGITADLQLSLLMRVIEKDLFWPDIAACLNIIEPKFHKPEELGTKSPFFIVSEPKRGNTADSITQTIQTFKDQIVECVKYRAQKEVITTYNSFLTEYSLRYKDERENYTKLSEIELELTNTFTQLGTTLHDTPSLIQQKCATELTLIKIAMDDLADMLIVFAIPKAIDNCRRLLRAIFHHTPSKYKTFALNTFHTHIKIDASDVPPVTAKKHPLTSDNPGTTHPGANHTTITDTNASHTGTSHTSASHTNTHPMGTSSSATHTTIPHTPQTPIVKSSLTSTATTNTANLAICVYDVQGCGNRWCTQMHYATHVTPCHHGAQCRHKDKVPPCKFLHVVPPKRTPAKRKHVRLAIDSDTEDPQPHTTPTPKRGNQGKEVSPTACTVSPSQHSPTTTSLLTDIKRRGTSLSIGPKKRRRLDWSRRHNTDTTNQRLLLLRRLCRNVTNNEVHVLNDVCLVSEEELLVLSLGDNFVAKPLNNKQILLSQAVSRFTRQVRIKKHFATLDLNDTLTYSTELLLHLRINKSLSMQEAQINSNQM